MISSAAVSTEAGPSRRFRLRDATADAHQRVEDIVARADSFGNRKRYLAWLEASFAIRSGVEDALNAAGAERLWRRWPDRRIAGMIADDIADLGGRKPVPGQVEISAGPAEVLGMLYVLEGSSLGARLLVKSAAELGFHEGFGARHLHRQCADPAAWRDFVALLDDQPFTPAAERACVEAALATFKAFGDAYQARA